MGLTHNQALIRATARASFWQRYMGMPSIMDKLFQQIDSNADQETYPGLYYAPGVREMTGSRDHRTVPGFDFTIKNKKWESTVDIAYETVKFGKLGAVEALLGSMGDKARKYHHKLSGNLLNIGDAAGSLGHDGQIFFSAAHVDAGATYTSAQDNDLAGSGAAPGAPTELEMSAALRGALTAFQGFKDGDGDPAGPNGDGDEYIALCSPGNFPAAQAVYMNNQLTGPVGNELQGMFKPVLNQYSDAATEMFVFWVNGPRKPFIYQVAEAVSLEDNMGGDSEFETKDVSFGSFGYYNVGYGEWRTACSITFA